MDSSVSLLILSDAEEHCFWGRSRLLGVVSCTVGREDSSPTEQHYQKHEGRLNSIPTPIKFGHVNVSMCRGVKDRPTHISAPSASKVLTESDSIDVDDGVWPWRCLYTTFDTILTSYAATTVNSRLFCKLRALDQPPIPLKNSATLNFLNGTTDSMLPTEFT